MAKRIAGDRHLDFEGMKFAVRNAIDLYERGIAGAKRRPTCHCRRRSEKGTVVEMLGEFLGDSGELGGDGGLVGWRFATCP
jgi:hypothetical protein